MELELVYEKQEDIPTGFEGLYTEKSGKWHLVGVKGLKTNDDVAALNRSLTAARADAKKYKDLYAKFGDHDPDQLVQDLQELETLRGLKETGGLQPGDDKINSIVEERVARRLAPIERQRDKALADLTTLGGEVTELKTERKRGKITDAMRAAATKHNVVPTALDDVTMHAERLFDIDDNGMVIARDGVGVPPGMTPEEWIADQQSKRPHWWPPSAGGGARGSGLAGEKNPWSKEHWSVTDQVTYYKTHGEAKAIAMAAKAGSKMGATKPPV